VLLLYPEREEKVQSVGRLIGRKVYDKEDIPALMWDAVIELQLP
jgi:hypothetical protein